jgi:diphthamide synthase (EF-2-diphthine--ammonia ligase)
VSAEPQPIWISWSGGKDCLMALERLRADPAWRVVGAITTVTSAFDRVAMHGIRRDVLHAQTACLRLPLIEATLPWPASNADYEAAFADAIARARAQTPGLAHVAYGDLFLQDVRDYRDAQLRALDLAGVYPLWGENTAVLARTFVRDGYRARLTCVDSTQLDATFSGSEFDAALLAALPGAVDPCGENGEFHTLSYAGPSFTAPLSLRVGERVLRDARFAYTDFELA